MKRALQKEEKAVVENPPGDKNLTELLNPVDSRVNHRMPTTAAMIGLAISMGATSLLVTRQSDQALAADSVGEQKPASIIPAVPSTKVNFAPTKTLGSQAVSSVSVPENPAIVEPTAISQVPGLGAKLRAAANKNSVVINSSKAAKNDKAANKTVVVTASTDKADAQLKAQQKFALTRLQQKSNRLRESLTQLRSQETKDLSTATTKSVKADRKLAPRTVKENSETASNSTKANLVSRLKQHKNGASAQASVEFAPSTASNNQVLNPVVKENNNTGQKNSNSKTDVVIPKATAQVTQTQPNSANAYGVGGDTPIPTAFVEIQTADKRVKKAKQVKNNQRLRSLKEEIERLREKYRAQESGKPAVAEKEEPERNNAMVLSPLPRNSRAAVPIFVPRPNMSKSGNQSVDSLGTMRGTQVSPELPPLAAVDRYLPRPIESVPSSSTYIWPAKGTLTSGYGWRWGRMHRGIDIANSTGTPIYASADGIVSKAGWNRGGYGKLVEIRHPDGSLTRYAHNSKIMVKVGQQVNQGQTIALMGSTGFSTGPHTHFEIHPNGKGAVNPIAMLPKRRERL
ncbi:MAG: peptidoglycan DD-metalloendopeptidase family protein [Nostocaceae cyanobacterium]|nr:peptidoglycan DD-metalloendopeptidase family protein [Nostocaceae cyanobacterium]